VLPARIQQHLEAIYGIRCELQVTDCLLDEQQARALGGTMRAREELLVREEEGQMELGLFLAPELLHRATDLGAFCEAAEGVSHFLYLHRAAALDRRVSLLELEAQAEVDKFAICALGSWTEDGQGSGARSLFGRLFDDTGLRAELTEPETWRYREANRLARIYCRRLLPIIAARRLEKLLAELRYAYRLGAEAKLDYLAR
jgi:hypothetical protein